MEQGELRQLDVAVFRLVHRLLLEVVGGETVDHQVQPDYALPPIVRAPEVEEGLAVVLTRLVPIVVPLVEGFLAWI